MGRVLHYKRVRVGSFPRLRRNQAGAYCFGVLLATGPGNDYALTCEAANSRYAIPFPVLCHSQALHYYANLCNPVGTRLPDNLKSRTLQSRAFHRPGSMIDKCHKVRYTSALLFWLVTDCSPPPCKAFISGNNSNCTQWGFFVCSSMLFTLHDSVQAVCTFNNMLACVAV